MSGSWLRKTRQRETVNISARWKNKGIPGKSVKHARHSGWKLEAGCTLSSRSSCRDTRLKHIFAGKAFKDKAKLSSWSRRRQAPRPALTDPLEHDSAATPGIVCFPWSVQTSEVGRGWPAEGGRQSLEGVEAGFLSLSEGGGASWANVGNRSVSSVAVLGAWADSGVITKAIEDLATQGARCDVARRFG